MNITKISMKKTREIINANEQDDFQWRFSIQLKIHQTSRNCYFRDSNSFFKKEMHPINEEFFVPWNF